MQVSNGQEDDVQVQNMVNSSISDRLEQRDDAPTRKFIIPFSDGGSLFNQTRDVESKLELSD